MKRLTFILILTAVSALAKDTITFPEYQTTPLYQHQYSYGGRYDWNDDRDDKYEYGHPSIPEPSTWSLLVGMCALSAAFVFRRQANRRTS